MSAPFKPLTQVQLDARAAAGSDCPRCVQHHANTYHPATPCHPQLNLTAASYAKGSGVLRIVCFICGQVVEEIKVAAS